MNSVERVKYFYETIISENQIEKVAEFVSPECCVKIGEKLIPVGVERMEEHIKKPTNRRLVFTGVDIDKVIAGKIVEHGGAVNTFETLFEAGMIGPI